MDTGLGPRPAFGPKQLGVSVLAGILSASADAIVIIDSNRRYLYANPAAGEIAGIPHEDLIGRDFLDNIAPRMHDTILGGFQKSLSGSPGRRSSVVIRPDGSEREIEYSTMSLHHDGQPLVASIFHDVTEERQQEREAAALLQIASSLTLDQSLEDKLNALASSIEQATRAVASSVLLVDESSLELKKVGAKGFPDGVLEALIGNWSTAASAGSRVVRAFTERRTFIIDDARANNLSNPKFALDPELVEKLPWDIIVATPIIYHSHALGVLCAYFAPDTRVEHSELELLQAVANQAAVAIENHRLYEEAQGVGALEERTRLARELHDSVSQALYGIGLGARTARTLVDIDPKRAIEPVEYVLSLADIGLAEMRALVFELRPEALETDGLVTSLRKQVESLHTRHDIEVDFADCEEPDLPLPVKEAVYRIAQEAIHNTIKHARASTLTIELVCTPTDLILELSDNGNGFDSGMSFPGHLGLKSMRERAASLNGQVEIVSEPGNGARVRAEIPIGRYRS
jgi:PAS domain S-box-containing protein